MKCYMPFVCKVGAVKRFKFLIIRQCRIIPIFCEQGGDEFHILLRDHLPEGIDSLVACFQNCGEVHLEKSVNFLTLTGSTPRKFSLALLIHIFCIFLLLDALVLNCSAH